MLGPSARRARSAASPTQRSKAILLRKKKPNCGEHPMMLIEITGNREREGILSRLLVGVILAWTLLVGVAQAQTPAPVTGLEGTWAGVLGGQLHLIVTIKKSGDGGFEGTLNSVDQHATLAMSSITLTGDSVRFEVPHVGGVYEGRLNKSEDVIAGSWIQTGTLAQPLDLKRTAK